MDKALQKRHQRTVRHRRIRSRISGTTERPRLVVYRSNSYIYAQLIDDNSGKTIVSASDVSANKGSKLERASAVGKEVAEKAKKAGVEKVVFDRAGFLFAGRVKALAEAARASGLVF